MTEDRPRMLRWMVTGPMGAGKSLLVEHLVRQGAASIDADRLGHALLEESDLVTEIRKTFGASVLRDGVVERRALGRVVFGDVAELHRLNALVHPRLAVSIRQAYEVLARQGETDLAVAEAAVYFLLPSVGPVDLTISVVAPEPLRLQRLLQTARVTEAEARQRLAAQADLESFWQEADVVLTNDRTEIEFFAEATRQLGRHWRGMTAESSRDGEVPR
ncbi:MAG: dephospho-CoA kinase [bacterium]